jgi:hypothetical protein
MNEVRTDFVERSESASREPPVDRREEQVQRAGQQQVGQIPPRLRRRHARTPSRLARGIVRQSPSVHGRPP